MIGLLCFVLVVLASPFKSKLRLEAENAMLRHQLIVLRRRLHGRVRLTNNDRWFFIQLYRWFPSILQVLTIIRPENRCGRAWINRRNLDLRRYDIGQLSHGNTRQRQQTGQGDHDGDDDRHPRPADKIQGNLTSEKYGMACSLSVPLLRPDSNSAWRKNSGASHHLRFDTFYALSVQS